MLSFFVLSMFFCLLTIAGGFVMQPKSISRSLSVTFVRSIADGSSDASSKTPILVRNPSKSPFERIESLKCAVAGLLFGGVAAFPFTYLQAFLDPTVTNRFAQAEVSK